MVSYFNFVKVEKDFRRNPRFLQFVVHSFRIVWPVRQVIPALIAILGDLPLSGLL